MGVLFCWGSIIGPIWRLRYANAEAAPRGQGSYAYREDQAQLTCFVATGSLWNYAFVCFAF